MQTENEIKNTELSISVSDTLKVKPDTAIISITVSNKDDTDLGDNYEEAYKVGADKLSNLLSIIKNFGVKQDQIKVARLAVRAVYTDVGTKKESGGIFGTKETEVTYSKKLIGYAYSSVIDVKIPSETEYLSKLYCDLIVNENAKHLDIMYIIDNTEACHDELLDKLINKARHKAEIIAKASGLNINKILNINLGCSSTRYRGATISKCTTMDFCCEADSSFADFEASVSDTLDSLANTEKEFSENIEIKFELV